MREHMGLYRGKEKRTGKWHFGFYVRCKITNTGEIGNYIQTVQENGDIGVIYEVDPDTVGECTGLPDKNGKLIFEGDIVKSVFNQRPYLVCFGEYLYREEYGNELSACGFYNKDAFDCVTDFGSPEEWAIIIGNVHDNPELLKGAGENETDCSF